MGAIIFNVLLLIIFSVFLKISFGIEDLREVDPLGAAGFPTAILIILVPLILISLVNAIKDYLKNKEKQSTKETISRKSGFITVGIVILISIFILLLDVVGFLLACLLLTPLLLLILGETNKLRLILLSVFIPITMTVLFGVFLSIPLPRGIGVFLEISRLIY